MMAPSPGDDHLYVIGESADSTVVKIGRSNNPAKRLIGVQTGHPRKLSVLHVEHGAGPLEEDAHKALAACRLNGEWFDFGDKPAVGTVRQVVADLRTLQEIGARNAVMVNLAATYRPARAPATPEEAPGRLKGTAKRIQVEIDPCEGFAVMDVINAAVDSFFATCPDPTAELRSKGVPAHHIALYYRALPRHGIAADAALQAEAQLEIAGQSCSHLAKAATRVSWSEAS